MEVLGFVINCCRVMEIDKYSEIRFHGLKLLYSKLAIDISPLFEVIPRLDKL